MSHSSKDVLSPEKQALLMLRKMRAKLDEMERARTEPIAIVGMGCRFPGGVVDGDSFWRLLAGGVDAVTDVPRDRFDVDAFFDPNPESRGTIYTRRGGFVPDIDRFDAPFFGISRREAVSLDPQQRLLLEVAWEALENAGQPPDALQRTKTGVFMGISSGDYGQLQMQRRDRTGLDLYFGTGIAPSAVAGRLSYVLGLVGPSIAVDTACSASLVAVHLACQSLRAGECRAALAGGVNLNILPEIFISLCTARMLAPDGRCKAFDAAADGYVRGEGCGVVVLKRLSDALGDGDRILALIRGTVVNQDGRSGGFTAPSELSQEALLRDAVARAGVAPADVDYVEAHGTGTPLGDPIEMQALAAVLCNGRPPDRPLAVGSVKTNLGHLEAAAGIAGLIKVVLALQHRTIPPHLHLTRLNPLLALNGAPIVVPTTARPWPSVDRAGLAGVSSFGFTGTNAHAVLEAAPAAQPAAAECDRPCHILTLSAKTEGALERLAERYEAYLRQEGADVPLSDVSFTANSGRTHFAHRLAVTGSSIGDVRGALAAWRAGDARARVPASTGVPRLSSDIAFLFTGQGSQYVGMGRQLYELEPTFRRAMQRCDEVLRPHLGDSILSVIYPESGMSPLLDQTCSTQPALFALEYALAELWLSWGVEPAFVMGHSLGEYVAAAVAGLFSLEDAAALVAVRGRLMQALSDGGEMVAALAGEPDVRRALSPDESAVSIAALNGPENVVISGAGAAVRAVRARLELAGVRTERLSVSHAFHSALMDPILEEFARVAGGVTYTTPRFAIVSNLTGDLVDPSEISRPDYWCRHLRETVRFAAGVQTLYANGVRTFVEIGPSPTLSAMGRRIIADEEVSWLPSLRKGRDDWKQMLDTLGQLYVRDAAIDWKRFHAGLRRRKVTLPTYPFERLSYWVEGPAQERVATAVHAQAPAPGADSRELGYELVWQRERVSSSRRERRQFDRCVIFADASGIGAELACRSREDGVPALAVIAGREYRRGEGTLEIAPGDSLHYQRLLNEVAPDGDLASTAFVYLWAADEFPSPTACRPIDHPAYTGGCDALLLLVQALTGPRRQSPRLWIATRGAQSVHGEPVSLAGAAAWGFGRVLGLEHPDLWGGLIDLQPGTCEDDARALWSAIASGGEEQLAVREAQPFVPRLAKRELDIGRRATRLSPDGTYLITGGLGRLGLRVANWMADRGARHVVLVSRSGLPDRATWDATDPFEAPSARIAAVRQLEQRGVDVAIVSADVADRTRMASVIEQLRTPPYPLRGIVHAAGVSDPALIRDLDIERLQAVLRPKVAGAWILHELTADLPLDPFVLFSSISSVWGSKGLAAYAAANHFLDALAHHRRALGLSALSVNWGPWAGGGMASDEDLRTLAALGIESLAPESALPALDSLLATGAVQAAVARVDWNVFKPLYAASDRRMLLEKIEADVKPDPPSAATASDLLRQTIESSEQDRLPLLRAALQRDVAAVLGEDVPCDRPLAALGLDSLMALEIRNRIQRAFGVTVPVVSFLNGADVNGLAASILHDIEAREVDISSNDERTSSPSTAPLSSAQRRIWFFEQLRPDTGTFNDQLVVRLEGSLDVPSLERAVARILARHDVLRTTIVAGDDGPVQRVALSPDRSALEMVDLSSTSEPREHARRLVDDNLRERFDLQRGPLFRARLYRLSATEHVLAYAIHHVINDGWSLRVFIDELCHWYTAAATGVPGTLPALPVQYAALARRQQQALAGEVYSADLAYWRERLANAPRTTELPTDYPRMDGISPVGASRSRLLDRALSGRLRDLARNQGATLYMTLLAAFKCLISRLTGQADLVVGSPVSVRSAEAEPLIGCFINQLALRTDLSDDPPFLEVLRRVRETALGAYAHQEVPFEKIVETLQPRRDPNRPPFFQILFNMLVAPPSRITLPGVAAEIESTADDWARFDLTMYVFERDDSLGLHLVYNANLYTEATAATVIDRFEHLLQQVAADPHLPVSTYSLLTSAEQDSMAGAFTSQLE
jgi:acyl transferase domain-containing protein/acyl carrier protein